MKSLRKGKARNTHCSSVSTYCHGFGAGKAIKKGKAEPTREEMLEVVSKMLQEVDFNTATLSDILKKLSKHFGVDLSHRKPEVKAVITDAISAMTDEEDEEENSEAGSDGEKEEEKKAEAESDKEEEEEKDEEEEKAEADSDKEKEEEEKAEAESDKEKEEEEKAEAESDKEKEEEEKPKD
ncbi:hypothetical protein F2Q68_00018994 [Brassica cretica]|uniref:DEK-C domain-containing protein n=1 Tax=Brassica cretica TaxID=69181 RepID=A0A8S9FUC6_BRACR|nr:hypothetical protein F2Q68_00018994 [Brassica cretica]